MRNTELLNIRIDKDTKHQISLLKQAKIKHTTIIRKAIKQSINDKVKELFKVKEFEYPF